MEKEAKGLYLLRQLIPGDWFAGQAGRGNDKENEWEPRLCEPSFRPLRVLWGELRLPKISMLKSYPC